MAMLPFLGVGQTHMDGTYREVVLKGLQWLTREQVQEGPNVGDLRGPGHGRMYAHGQAAIPVAQFVVDVAGREHRQCQSVGQSGVFD